jgi:hypothetical protein
VQFSTTGGFTMIQQINAMGQVVRMITRQDYQPGTYTLSIYGETLPAGQYFFRLQNKSYQKVVNVIKMR